MGGHFTRSNTWRELVELYRLTQPPRNLRARYNNDDRRGENGAKAATR